MEGKSGESGAAEEAPPPSVAKLAGLFGDKVNNPKKEAPPHKPTRRKPPCSLPLTKPEATNNGDEKGSPPHTQMPKIKVKSSPLIEKLQANLAFAPASFIPGSSPKSPSPKSPSPKSPGLKIMACPFTSPPSTPSSPGFQQRASEEETPASFEQPPDGAPLSSYTKVRTRGSLKRRPPSRRFRKSQGDMDFDIDAVNAAPKENGDKAEEEGTGGLKDKEETEPDAPSHDPAEKSPDPAEKSPESAQEDSGKEEQGAGETPNKEDTPLDTNVTDSPIIKEGSVLTEVSDETQNVEQGADESSEQNKSDGDDKPEK